MKRSLALPVLAIMIFFILIPASSLGLNLNLSGGYVNEPVIVTMDREAYVIFSMNNGTPVFTYGSEVKFIPHVTGNLRIEVRAGDEVVERVIEIVERESESAGGGRSNLYYSGIVYLPEGTFTLTAMEGKTYSIDWRTAMGALKAASDQGGFSFSVKETDWGPFVSCIAGKCEKSDGPMSGWMYQVNGIIPAVGAHEYKVSQGDEVVWYFSRSMDETPETSPMIVELRVMFAETPSGGGMGSTEGGLNQTNENYREVFARSISAEPDEEVFFDFPENISEEFSIVSLKTEAKNETVKIELGRSDVGGLIYGKVLSTFYLSISGGDYFEVIFRTGKDVNKNSVVMMKFNEKWLELPTEFVKEDEDYYYFRAEISNFSILTIVERWNAFPLNVTDEPILRALKWLMTIQNEDGGFANPGEESSISKTSWAIMALAASKQNPHKWTRNGNSPVDYIRENLNSSLGKMGTADIARTILALTAANQNPRNFSGIDLVSMLKEKVRDNGQIGDFIYTTIWGIMALKAAGENVSRSVEWLKAQQNDDGGFAWAVGEKSDYDDTAAAVQALIAAGEPKDSEVIRRALDYLRTGQNEDGGFRYFGNSSSNAASDAWIIQALVAAGENPREWKRNGISVVDHLLSLQTEEGYFKYTSVQTSNPGYMTVCAVMALLGKPNPIKPDYLQGEVNLSSLAEKAVKATPEPTETPISTPVKVETPSQTPTPAVTATEEVKTEKTPEAVVTEKSEKTPGFEALAGLVGIALALAWRKWGN